MTRVFNFSAGPSQLPTEVLQKCAAELMEYGISGTIRHGDESSILILP